MFRLLTLPLIAMSVHASEGGRPLQRIPHGHLEVRVGEEQVGLQYSNRLITVSPTTLVPTTAALLEMEFGWTNCQFDSDAAMVAALELPTTLKCDQMALTVDQFHESPVVNKLRTQPRTTDGETIYNNIKARKAEPREFPYLAGEILGDVLSGDLGYMLAFLKNHWGPLHPFNVFNSTQTGIYDMATGQMKTGKQLDQERQAGLLKRATGTPVTMALTADWGAGTLEADTVAKLMVKDFPADFTLHLGDVYYVGTVDEVESNCLGIPPANVVNGVKWPTGKKASFALMGNHEMYSRGYGFYDHWLPKLGPNDPRTNQPQGQPTSYFVIESAFWRLIFLDTGTNSYSDVISHLNLDSKNTTQPDPVIKWLRDVVKIGDPNDKRAIMFLSHHQYFSAFDEVPTKDYPATPGQLAALIPKGRRVMWLWGHEHRLAFYELRNASGIPLNVHARCVGNSGFPTVVSGIPPNARTAGLQAFDDRLYEIESGWIKVNVSYNGFTRLTFTDDVLELSYHSLRLEQGKLDRQNSELLVTEQWVADAEGHAVQKSFTIHNKEITVVTHEQTDQVVEPQPARTATS